MKRQAQVTVSHAVKEAAKTQSSTVLAAVLILLAYVAGMTASEYCGPLFDPLTRSDIFE